MTILSLIVATLLSCFADVKPPMVEYHFECNRIGDNVYTCDGGHN